MIKSIVLSSILKTISNILFIVDTFLVIKIVFVPTILAYFIGRLWRSDDFNNVLLKIKINRTTNENLWADVIKEGLYLWIIFDGEEKSYLGQCVYCGEGEMSSLMVLSKYQELDSEGQVIHDYYNEPTRRIVVDTSRCSRIELFYQKELSINDIIKKIKDYLVKRNKHSPQV
nr:hypothetical protein [uncultured Aminipila sp.]